MSGASRPRATSVVNADRPEMAVKMDYSNIYKENEELEYDLEDKIDDIHKNKYRAWQEKRQQLKVIKQQVDVIMRLRAAVNSRRPGESIDIVASSRPRRASRPSLTSTKTKADDSKEIDIDVAEMTQNNKTQMRISQEREKFSSKNLFNVRRKNRGLGGVTDTSHHHGYNHTNNNNNHHSTQATPFSVEGTGGKLFTRRSTSLRFAEINGGIPEEDISNSNTNNSDTGKRSNNNSNGGNLGTFSIRPSSDRPRTACYGEPKSYMQETVSSRKGSRPKTAMGISSEKGLDTDNGSSPSSRRPSAKRCRSRRQLELLSRLNLSSTQNDSRVREEEEEEERDEEEGKEEVIRASSRRNAKLQQLRSDGHELQSRVDRFLHDLHRFNTVKKSSSTGGAHRHPGILLFDD